MKRVFFWRSLRLRMLVPLILCNTLVWLLMLIGDTMKEATIDVKDRKKAITRALTILEQSANREDAVMQTLALSTFYEWYAGSPNLIELWSHDQQRLYMNKKRVTFTYAPLQGDPEKVTEITANGKKYNLIRQDGARWSLRIAIPQPSQALHEYLVEAASTHRFMLQVILSFSIFILILWFALGRGLRPLYLLGKELEQRSADDLSPLHFNAHHAELQPTVAALDTLLERLRNALAQEQGFIQDAAQRLRAPMRDIAAQVAILAKATDAREKMLAEQQINLAITAASHLIQQLLDMARVDGFQPQNTQLLDCAEVVRTQLLEQLPRAMARQIEMSLDAPPALLHRIDKAALQLILHNLLDNAIRYNYSGGWIAVSLQKSGEDLVLTVANAGPGIPECDRERVFERFYRCPKVGDDDTMPAEPGSGLGLAIVRQAALRLGGNVQLCSDLPQPGCRFIVTLASGMVDKAHLQPIKQQTRQILPSAWRWHRSRHH